jgi:hypothetical protein
MLSNRVAFFLFIAWPLFIYASTKNEWLRSVISGEFVIASGFFWFYCYVTLMLSFGIRFRLLSPNIPAQVRVARGFYPFLTKEGRARAREIFGINFHKCD